MSCGVGGRRGSDPPLLWLWRRPAATALIPPLAWEPSHAAGAAQEKAKKQNKTKQKTKHSITTKQTKNAPRGARTHDRTVKSRTLYRLS